MSESQEEGIKFFVNLASFLEESKPRPSVAIYALTRAIGALLGEKAHDELHLIEGVEIVLEGIVIFAKEYMEEMKERHHVN
jgi:hypothetical protein